MNTKKDFVLAATIVQEMKAQNVPEDSVRICAAAFCTFFAMQNPHFDMRRFADACEIKLY